MDNATARLSAFIAGTNFAKIPEKVRAKMRECLIDFLGVSSVAYLADSTPSFFAAIDAIAGDGDCTVVGHRRGYPFQYAAMLNGTLAHTSDFDDTNAIGGGHLGAPVIAAGLAAAERFGASGEDFVSGLVAGYETMVRVGTGLGISAYERGFHPTAVDGVFGATAAVCRIARADARVTEHALGLALSTAAGSMQYLENGAWNKRLHPGLAAYHANLVYVLANAGVIGAALPLEGKFGLLQGYSDKPDPSWLDRALGTDWYTLNTAIKPYPSCRFTHGAVDVARALRTAHGLDVASVDAIDVTISPVAYEIVGDSRPNKLMPNNVVDAQFSMYFQVAAALIDGNVFWDSYRLIGDPRIEALSGRLRIGIDAGYSKLQTTLSVRAGGRTFAEQVTHPKGDDRNPLAWDDIMAKFRGNAACRFDATAVKRIEDGVDAIERCTDVRAWIRATLRGDARSA